jgi:hypothetical protein
VACDFFVAVTARFHVLYVFMVMEVGSPRILHMNVTDHPTACGRPTHPRVLTATLAGVSSDTLTGKPLQRQAEH